MYCVCAYALLDGDGFCDLCTRPVEAAVSASYRRGMRFGALIAPAMRLFCIVTAVVLSVYALRSGLHGHYPIAVEATVVGLVFWLFGLSDSIDELSEV